MEMDKKPGAECGASERRLDGKYPEKEETHQNQHGNLKTKGKKTL